MEDPEAADQVKAFSQDRVSTVDSTSIAVPNQPSGVPASDQERANTVEQTNSPAASDVEGSATSTIAKGGDEHKSPSRDKPRTRSNSDNKSLVAAIQSRIKDLFWLEHQPQGEIQETLKKEWPKEPETKFFKLIESTLRDEKALGMPDGNGNEYTFTKAGLLRLSGSGDELQTTKITNFRCISLTPISRDDGVQQTELLRLELGCQNRTTTIELSPDEFRQMNWHFPLFNQLATVTPKMKEYAVFGFQLAAPRKDKVTIYTSTGWINVDGQPYFFHNDGAIGAKEHRKDIKAELKENLRRYSLPDPPTGDSLKKAIRAPLKLLDVAEPGVAIPLFAAIWRPPLGNVDFAGWANGITNSLKTSHALVAQQFYGKDFDKKHLPATWFSTTNFNMSRLHAAKDVFCVIDDFVLRGGKYEQQKQLSDADRFVRAVADGAFRGRLDAKHSDDAPSRGPRGLAWSTAETNSLGESGQARLINPTYRRKDDGTPVSVEPVKLRECQLAAESGLYSEAMAGYVQFLAQRYDDLLKNVPIRIKELTGTMSESADGQLLRTPEILANLAVGIEYFLSFAIGEGAIDEQEYHRIWERCWKTLISVGEVQTQRQHEEDPVRETLRLLKSADRAGRLLFRKPDGDTGELADAFLGPSIDLSQNRSDRFIGWRQDKDSDWWCDPAQLWKMIQALFREQNRTVPKKKVELFEEMENGGWITPRDEKQRGGIPTVKREIDGKRERVIEIPAQSFVRLEHEGTSEDTRKRVRKEIAVPLSDPQFSGTVPLSRDSLSGTCDCT